MFGRVSRPCPVLRYNVYTYEGSDDPWVVESGRQQDNRFFKNTIIGSAESISLRAADGTKFNKNIFEDATNLRFDDCTGTIVRRNTGLDDVEQMVVDSCFHENSDSDFVPIC